MKSNKSVSRRSFLSIGIGAIGGLISLAIGAPAIAYLISPILKQNQAEKWLTITSTSKVDLKVPVLFKKQVVHQVGWTSTQEELAVYLYTDDGRNFIALSNICTHLGCRVRWLEDNAQFSCPCHTALFDKAGNVVSGPPPKPLDRYQVKVENDQILILLGG